MMLQISVILLGLALQEQDDPEGLIQAFAKLNLEDKAKPERREVVFDQVSKERIVLAHRLVGCGRRAVRPLTEALKSESRHVRAMAAELLGVLGDASAVPALVSAAGDPDATVRIYAIQSLGWLKASPEAVARAAKDANANVRFIAGQALVQAREDCKVKEAYGPIESEKLGAAEVGARAPDFTLPTSDGKPWKLSDQKGLVVLMFQLADW